ncbi:uncharacterized protein LOC121385689 isoform X1 [Gigantopelta aegis]|uniref:uncharacterized protein LOC121385689 isoform X1 n=1 Tax=Gigantopelta aegis TaxID=1735272 RepID=UPI001B88AE71|nr:uncharacterized protein LOC121385689 isoform X1 [Gigantopelta aegis]
MTTTEDDGIEILSCHTENDNDVTEQATTVSVSAESAKLTDDPASKQRKRVARAVAIVSFTLLLFSVVLIGVSLNMSKNIDDLDEDIGTSFYPETNSQAGNHNNPVRQSNEILRKHHANKNIKADHNVTGNHLPS